MRIPSFSRHSGSTATRDDNRDGVPDNAGTGGPGRARVQTDERTAQRSGPYFAEEPTTQRIQRDPADTRHDLPAVPTDRGSAAPVRRADADHPAPVAGPRPRASLLATLSLVVGVVAALFVLSGTLAGYGIVLGALATLLAVGGIWATRRRHVAGKSDALLGLALGLGAVVLGVLAFTGSLSWLGTDVDTVSRLREWLDAQFTNRF